MSVVVERRREAIETLPLNIGLDIVVQKTVSRPAKGSPLNTTLPPSKSLTNFTCIDMSWMCLQAPVVLDWARRADCQSRRDIKSY